VDEWLPERPLARFVVEVVEGPDLRSMTGSYRGSGEASHHPQLRAEVADLMAKAEAADQADVPDGMSIPEELARREQRLAAIARAKATIQARAKQRHAREQAEHDAQRAQRAAKTATTGKKPSGRVPQPPVEGPLPTDQVNLTDEESRVMPVAGGGFEQCYNAQAVVAAGSLLVIAADVVQAPNDKQQFEPAVAAEPCAACGDAPSAQDAPGQAALCSAQANARTGVRRHQVGAWRSSVSASRPRECARRVEPRDHGVEYEADVRYDGGDLSQIGPCRDD